MKERYLSKTPFLTFVYISKCNINLPGYFGNSKKRFLWTGLVGMNKERIILRSIGLGHGSRWLSGVQGCRDVEHWKLRWHPHERSAGQKALHNVSVWSSHEHKSPWVLQIWFRIFVAIFVGPLQRVWPRNGILAIVVVVVVVVGLGLVVVPLRSEFIGEL